MGKLLIYVSLPCLGTSYEVHFIFNLTPRRSSLFQRDGLNDRNSIYFLPNVPSDEVRSILNEMSKIKCLNRLKKPFFQIIIKRNIF